MRDPTRPAPSVRAREVGFFAVVVALPLVLAPFTTYQFVDVKLLVLLVGALLIASSGFRPDRLIAAATGAWVAVVAVATVVGLDPWWSLVGPENRGMGLVALGACGVLLCAATGVGADLRDRIPGWLFWTGVLVSAVAVVGRFVDIGGQTWELGPLSSTIGHRVFAGGFIAAAIVAATALRSRPVVWAGLLVLGSGLAVGAARGAWAGAALGLAGVLVRERRWRAMIPVLVPLVIALAGWTLADRGLTESQRGIEFSAAPRFFQLEEGSAQERIPSYRANLRAWADDPILGTGPGTGWYGYLTHVSDAEFRSAGRGFADAHNLLIESATTTGAIGALALLVLGVCVLIRLVRAPRDHAWALGVALALAVTHALQPLNLVTTPLMFLAAGLAIAPTTADPSGPTRWRRWLVVLVAVGLALAFARFLAASFERYGSSYASSDAFRWALRFEPRRLETTLRLAEHRAFDHRTGDKAAAREVRLLTQRAINQHPWHAQVRLLAANMALILDDVPSARAHVDEHLEIFPRDPDALAGASALALRAGGREEARTLARQALEVDPDHPQAQGALKAAEKRKSKKD